MWINKIKTVILLATLSGLLLALGNYIGGTFGIQFALIFAFLINFFAYFYSERIILRLYQAQKLDEHEHKWVHEIVTELCSKMKMRKPKLWFINTPVANAFATGRNQNHASVAITAGIVSILEKHELRAVLAHELAHIQNRDVLVSTIAATIATAIGYLAHMLRWSTFWGSGHKKRGGNPFFMFVVALLMPIAAMLIQLAISRSREYLADETGANCCHDPLALASALEKLHSHVSVAHFKRQDTARASTASLFIVHPFAGDSWLSLFSTHPPMHKRIERLRAMYQKRF